MENSNFDFEKILIQHEMDIILEFIDFGNNKCQGCWLSHVKNFKWGAFIEIGRAHV